ERLLLVGRAGSGKTTTLHYGALILARAARTSDSDETRTELQLFTNALLFPVYARLTEVMTYVREQYAQRRAELVGAPATRLPDFAERHLRPLDENDIRRLLNKLFLALRLPEERETPAMSDDPDALVREAAELWRNLERSPRLFDMATNPLLLTSMAVLVEGR